LRIALISPATMPDQPTRCQPMRYVRDIFGEKVRGGII
jgi:hypothetical protein